MSDTKFTKGEWEVFDSGYWKGVDCGETSIVVFGIDKDDLEGVRGETQEEAAANANLISAAPEMYEMLERLKVVVDDYDYDLFCSRGVGEWSQPDVSTEIDVLLAKARGE